jgi:hypothetical protein
LALLIGALSGDPQTDRESIIQQDADSRETEMPATNEYILPSAEILPKESKE